MKILARFIATFFGAGYFPFAPGTLTSLLMILAYKFILWPLTWPYYLTLLVVLFFLGVLSATVHSREVKQKDPRSIVIDESLGQLIPLFLLKPEWLFLAAAFFLFRFFDILKPFPVNKAESFAAGWGIMMDDVVAGLCTGIIINLYLIIT